MGPKGFLVPVWCVLTGCMGGDTGRLEPKAVSGVEDGRGMLATCCACVDEVCTKGDGAEGPAENPAGVDVNGCGRLAAAPG